MVKIWPIALGAALGAATVTGLGVGWLGAGFEEFVACCASELVGWGAGSMVFGYLLDVNVRVFGWNALIGGVMMEIFMMYNAAACLVRFSKFARKASFMVAVAVLETGRDEPAG
jgi:hypothetical protein